MEQYVEHTIGDTLIDSDRESNKSDDSDITREQQMFIWSPKFEVCCSGIRSHCNLRRIYLDLHIG